MICYLTINFYLREGVAFHYDLCDMDASHLDRWLCWNNAIGPVQRLYLYVEQADQNSDI